MFLHTNKNATLPGRKQVYRQIENGLAVGDVIGLRDEEIAGQPLVVKVMEGGRRLGKPDSIQECRERRAAGLKTLSDMLRELSPAHPAYHVGISAGLTQLQEEARENILHETD
jgi:nicotinate phosphoribosyltransferase